MREPRKKQFIDLFWIAYKHMCYVIISLPIIVVLKQIYICTYLYTQFMWYNKSEGKRWIYLFNQEVYCMYKGCQEIC